MAFQPKIPNRDADVQLRLGNVVRANRHRLGISQEELAWRASMHRTYLADIERGARNVTLKSIAGLARAFQMTIGELLTDERPPPSEDQTQSKPGGAAPAREILLIEDNAADAELAVRAFRRAKFTNPVRLMRDAEEAWDYLHGTGRCARAGRALPELILLDLNLPTMSGVEFLRRLKGEKRTRDIPVVVLTVSQSDHLIVECNRLGAVNYIVKPLGLENFLRVTPRLQLQLTLTRPPSQAKAPP